MSSDKTSEGSYFDGNLWTPEIESAVQLTCLWIRMDMCGAAFWGMPRVGKTAVCGFFHYGRS